MLGVTEHELLTASEDVETRNAETLARKYLLLLRRARWAQSILYGGVALICLICNLAVGHTLDWFWLVLTGELTGASLTLLPTLVPARRGAGRFGRLYLVPGVAAPGRLSVQRRGLVLAGGNGGAFWPGCGVPSPGPVGAAAAAGCA